MKPAYQALVDGKLTWVYPDEVKPQPKKRSRLETDEEVRRRIKLFWPATFKLMMGDESAHQLDQILHYLGDRRRTFDEVSP